MSDELKLKFDSPEEFALVCRYLGDRMHYLNRVAMGEKHFAHATADMIKRLGRSFAEGYGDADVNAAFGDGWTKGTVDRDARHKSLLARMYPED